MTQLVSWNLCQMFRSKYVHYSTSTVYGKKVPIVLWETHLADESGIDKVHYHTIVADSVHIAEALMYAGIYDLLSPYDAFYKLENNETVQDWLTHIDQR